MKTSETIVEISKALSKMQGSMDPAKKDKINPYFKSSYADLSSVWQAIRGPLMDSGLSVVQDATTVDGGISVVTRVLHVSGEWIEFGPLVVPLARQDAQSAGSAISYAKRYAIGAALGVVAEVDDDGNKASKNIKEKTTPPSYPTIDIETWYQKMEKDFDRSLLAYYVKEASQRINKNEQETVNYLASLVPVKFKESFERWSQKRISDNTHIEEKNSDG